MAKEAGITVSLEEFGLSSYEARAYVTLITKGTISASELAYYAELPRTKVYPVLLKLEKKKLAMISKSKPIMCTAIAPEDAFDEIIHEQINKVNAMNTLVTNLKKVSENTKKSKGSEEKRYFDLNANNVLEQLRQMIEGSKTSINIMVDPLGSNLLSECKEQFIGVLRRDLDVKIILTTSQIGSESFRTIPDGAKIKIAEIYQNCFIFDNTEVLIIDNENGKGSFFSSTEILGKNQTSVFLHVWKNALKTESIADMNKAEAQEVFKMINLIEQNGLGHVLNSSYVTKSNEIDLLKLLEKNGINIKSKNLEDVLEMIDSALQITCSGHANFNANSKNITIDSKLNSGHSLPWVSILNQYLHNQGYKTRMVLQNNSQKGEKIHIKIQS
jgi:HTH-type transcriptional regulator, sugar sensing transcriptional regulator